MSLAFLVCNTALGIGKNYIIWISAVILGNMLIPAVFAHIDFLLRTKVPMVFQGRIFSVYGMFRAVAMVIGNLTAGVAADRVLEPFMLRQSPLQELLSIFFGRGTGSGIAIMYGMIGIGGALGCCIFRLCRSLKALDAYDEE